jgi:hypothetical protein
MWRGTVISLLDTGDNRMGAVNISQVALYCVHV